MRKLLIVLILLTFAGCAPANTATEPEATARKLIHDAHQDSAKIIRTVQGDRKARNADELWCIQTDSTVAGGNIPLLLLVWRTGEQWQGEQLMEGFYEWDVQGCPR